MPRPYPLLAPLQAQLFLGLLRRRAADDLDFGWVLMRRLSSIGSTSRRGGRLVAELCPGRPRVRPVDLRQLPSFFFLVSLCYGAGTAPTTRAPAWRAISSACCTPPKSMFG